MTDPRALPDRCDSRSQDDRRCVFAADHPGAHVWAKHEPRLHVSGDTAVEVTTPKGERHSIRYVGIGHPWHTISNGYGRVSTDAEVAFAKALISDSATPDDTGLSSEGDR